MVAARTPLTTNELTLARALDRGITRFWNPIGLKARAPTQ